MGIGSISFNSASIRYQSEKTAEFGTVYRAIKNGTKQAVWVAKSEGEWFYLEVCRYSGIPLKSKGFASKKEAQKHLEDHIL